MEIDLAPHELPGKASERLGLHGAVILRQILDTTALSELLEEVRAAFKSLDGTRERLSREDRRLLDRMEMPVPDPRDSFRLQVKNYRILDSVRLRTILNAAIGPFLWHYPPMVRRQTPSSIASCLPYHQDWSYTRHYTRFYTCWTPLTRCGLDAPGLEVACSTIPEKLSHEHNGVWENGIAEDALRTILSGRTTYAPSLHPGDMVVFDDQTLHRTHLAEGMTLERINFDFRAVPVDAIPPEVRTNRKFVDPMTITHV